MTISAQTSVPLATASLEEHRARADANDRGRTLGAVTTSIVGLHVDAFGKGPTAARTDLREGDHALCVLRDVLTRAELTLVKAGRSDLVRQGREAAYAHVEGELSAIVERGVERPVVGFVPAIAPELGLVTLLFLLGPQA